MNCPVCGARNNDNMKFCGNCGAALPGGAAGAATPRPRNKTIPWIIGGIALVLVCLLLAVVGGYFLFFYNGGLIHPAGQPQDAPDAQPVPGGNDPGSISITTITPTATITLTATSNKVWVSVSTATYCRLGPTEAYPLLGTLYVGQIAEAIGRNDYGDSLVIKLPDQPNVECWLWQAYATVNGDKFSLPIIIPPPVPAPTMVTLTIKNNTAQPFCYVFFPLSSSSTWGPNQLEGTNLAAGASRSWSIAPGVYDVNVEDCVPNNVKNWYNLSITTDMTLVAP